MYDDPLIVARLRRAEIDRSRAVLAAHVAAERSGYDVDLTVLGARFAERAAGDAALTVIIPVHDGWEVTRRCLDSLAECDADLALRVVIVDDASTDATRHALAELRGIVYVRNGANLGFVGSCNRGAALVDTPLMLFLNNDTTLMSGALRALIDAPLSDPKIGVAGAKLVYPDGRLQEAGGIIFADAGGWNYGRLQHPDQPEFNFVRDVDYVSGAALVVRTALFRAVGGFDTRFAPAYYEDVDLCFAVRAAGFRTVYEPRAVVVHHEGYSAGPETGSGMKRFQAINKPKLLAKWDDVLQREHLPPSPDSVLQASNRTPFDRTILVIDSYVPAYDREAGSSRLLHLLIGFVEARQRVIFLPDNRLPQQPYYDALRGLGIEVLTATPGFARDWKPELERVLPGVDVVWICRPDLTAKYLPFIRAHSAAPIVYDTIDLHHVRARREAEATGSGSERWREMQALEFNAAFAADGTIVVSDVEREVLCEAGISPIAVIPTIHDPQPVGPRTYGETSGVLFIGGYNHPPNVDAARWLAQELMPLVWREHPAATLTLLGANPPASIRELASERVAVPGYIPDVEEYFLKARVFAAALRFGAGIKGKIGHSLSYGLPVVTTAVGAEGFGFRDGENALVVGSDTEGFARALAQLYGDAALWQRLSANCADALEPFTHRRVCADALRFLDDIAAVSLTC